MYKYLYERNNNSFLPTTRYACVPCWKEKCRIQFSVLQCSLCTVINFGNILPTYSYCARSWYDCTYNSCISYVYCLVYRTWCVDVDLVFVNFRIQNTKNNLLNVRRQRHRGHRSVYDKTLFSHISMTATLFR